eukprot:PhF_6_TR31965/c0_g1_i1/m.47458
MISQSQAQQLEGLLAFLDIIRPNSIIPLTITEVVDFICLKEDGDRFTNARSNDDMTLFDIIRRLEPFEDASGWNLQSRDECGESVLHHASFYGHDACIRTLLGIDPN